jgi:hypothetical protein
LFGLVFFSVGAGFLVLGVVPNLWDVARMQDWVQVPAEVVAADLETNHSSDGTTYKMIMSYETKRGTVYTHKSYVRNGIREKYEFYINGQRRSVRYPGKGK